MNGKQADTTSVESQDNNQMTRRRMMQTTGAVAAVAVVGTGTAAAQSTTGDVDGDRVDFSSNYVQAPYINASLAVDLTDEGMAELDYVADDGNVRSLSDDGIVLARRPDEDTPHNPVSLMASGFVQTTEEGDVEALDEFAAFPRGASYDDDADADTAEVDVSALDAEHWTVDNSGSTGTLTVSDDGRAVRFAVDAQASGDVATATFDLSTVASEDATIESGVARKFLQLVADVDTLPAGATVEVRLGSSTGQTVTASIGSSVDTSTEAGLLDSTGPSQVAQARVGELGTLDDIQTVEVAVLDAAADVALHALNVERESLWTFGQAEQLDEDSEVETVDVESPSGEFGVVSLASLSEPFASAAIRNIGYDVELAASALPAESIMARVVETPDTFSLPYEMETFVEFEFPTAYSLQDVTAENVADEVKLPSSRYQGVQVATGVEEAEDWDDVEGYSYTSRGDRYSSVDETVELLSTVAAADRTVVRSRILLDEDEVGDATDGSSGAAAAVGAAGGSGGGAFSWVTVLVAAFAGFVGVFRKRIFGMLG